MTVVTATILKARVRTGPVRRTNGTFMPDTHWRSPKPWWDAEWLRDRYVGRSRSAMEIASECGCSESNILNWLTKHGIPRRTVSEARQVKWWGSFGPDNPMYGRRGPLSPTWKGGHTPWRQTIYSRAEWRAFVRRIRQRDKSCRLCGSCEKMQIHHIETVADAPLLIMDDGNAILLCKPCHLKLKGKERRWHKRLYRIVNSNG